MKVMPFILRRTKDKVLADLPPKIIQDRYCKLSPLQLRLYEDFSRSQAKKEVSTLLQTYSELQVIKGCATSNAPSTHVFQVLILSWHLILMINKYSMLSFNPLIFISYP